MSFWIGFNSSSNIIYFELHDKSKDFTHPQERCVLRNKRAKSGADMFAQLIVMLSGKKGNCVRHQERFGCM